MPMNKIEKLIKELCPNGVEWKKLGEVCECITGGDSPKDCVKGQKFPTKDYPYPVYANGDETYGYAKSFRIDKYAVTISSIGNVGTAYYREPNFTPIIRLKTFIPKGHNLNVKFLYYCLSAMSFVGTNSSLSSMKAADFHKIPIPLPPLPIQTEIVRILDKFVEQQEQIERLIELRKKQYEYYREEMLKNVNGERGKLIDLLIQPITDGPHVTPKFVDEGVPFISATAIYDGKIHLKDAQGFVTKDFDKECSKKYKPKKFDVYMVKSGSTTGKVALVDFDDDFNVWSPLAAMRTQNEIQAKYLYHLLQTSNIQNQVLLGMSQGSQPNLSMRTLEQFNVIIPNNEEQERIVNVLDKIESNVFIMKSALEASKRRYEYYRDKMMRF